MQNIYISNNLADKTPGIKLSCIECDVQLEEKNEMLWDDIQNKIKELCANLKIENISKIPSISASRKAYKICGKDPARYRLSAEALLRRVIKRNEIYQINNVVDLLNLISVSTGFSIGGYDTDKIEGDVVFGIGENNEPYSGIGRGDLNIEYLPVFRDKRGAFGTPTSDSERTSVSLQTKRFLMIIIDFGVSLELNTATNMAVVLLKKYANATNFELRIINYNEENK
jgi:DNA/RNA-binding domain of Phe-tRNA-synthetase-like protein